VNKRGLKKNKLFWVRRFFLGLTRSPLRLGIVIERIQKILATFYIIGPNPRSCQIGEVLSFVWGCCGLCKSHAFKGMLTTLFGIARHFDLHPRRLSSVAIHDSIPKRH
jgi:hypothetical protein